MPNTNRLREEREARGWRRERLAADASISVPYVVKLEAGECNPSLPVARRIAAAMDTTVDALWPPSTFEVPAAEEAKHA